MFICVTIGANDSKVNYSTFRRYVLNPNKVYRGSRSGRPTNLTASQEQVATQELKASEDARMASLDNGVIATTLGKHAQGKPLGWEPSNRSVRRYKAAHKMTRVDVVTATAQPSVVDATDVQEWIAGYKETISSIPAYLEFDVDETNIVGHSTRKEKGFCTFLKNEFGRRRLLLYGVVPFHVTLCNITSKAGSYLPPILIVPEDCNLTAGDFPNWPGLAIFASKTGWMTGSLYAKVMSHVNMHVHKRLPKPHPTIKGEVDLPATAVLTDNHSSRSAT